MKTAVLICPGRGTYNRSELRTLERHGNPELLAAFEAVRAEAGQTSLAELDGTDRFSPRLHLSGENASALIAAAGLSDAAAIDRGRWRIVAVTGNSMGWYTALGAGGALPSAEAFRLANTMGRLMAEAMIGGQLVYPAMADDWARDPDLKAELLALVAAIGALPGHALSLSIDLGGYLVLAGDEAGLSAFEAAVPRAGDRYPMRLPGHAAFHSKLQTPVSELATKAFEAGLFGQPETPLVDGRGQVWWPGAVRAADLHGYTLGTQITETYDFSAAIRTAAREFAPDAFIVTGPGDTLGGAVAQSLIAANWRALSGKDDFLARQSDDPFVLSMGRADQRRLVTGEAGISIEGD